LDNHYNCCVIYFFNLTIMKKRTSLTLAERADQLPKGAAGMVLNVVMATGSNALALGDLLTNASTPAAIAKVNRQLMERGFDFVECHPEASTAEVRAHLQMSLAASNEGGATFGRNLRRNLG
jgi:pyruvoyl-dependent arginine decarboxylase (PvlArgDC)